MLQKCLVVQYPERQENLSNLVSWGLWEQRYRRSNQRCHAPQKVKETRAEKNPLDLEIKEAGDLGESLERLGSRVQVRYRGGGSLWGGEAGRMSRGWQLGGGAPSDGVQLLSVGFHEVIC